MLQLFWPCRTQAVLRARGWEPTEAGLPASQGLPAEPRFATQESLVRCWAQGEPLTKAPEKVEQLNQCCCSSTLLPQVLFEKWGPDLLRWTGTAPIFPWHQSLPTRLNSDKTVKKSVILLMSKSIALPLTSLWMKSAHWNNFYWKYISSIPPDVVIQIC